jgi:hypothetical protein
MVCRPVAEAGRAVPETDHQRADKPIWTVCVVIGDESVAAQNGGYLKSIWNKPWWGDGFASETCR